MQTVIIELACQHGNRMSIVKKNENFWREERDKWLKAGLSNNITGEMRG